MNTKTTAHTIITRAIAFIACLGCAEPNDQTDTFGDEESGDDTPVIYNGNLVEPCQFPSVAAVNTASGGQCSGTLIHPRVVVYAAHCGAQIDSIVFGETNTVFDGTGSSLTITSGDIERCGTHPEFNSSTFYTSGHDTAYCLLDKDVDLPTIRVAMGDELDSLKAGVTKVTAVGFGTHDDPDSSKPYGDKRFTANLRVEEILDGTVIRAAGEAPHFTHSDTCKGDSGGPLFMRDGERLLQVGITSADYIPGKCGTPLGGLYSPITPDMPWLEEASGLDLTPCHDANGTDDRRSDLCLNDDSSKSQSIIPQGTLWPSCSPREAIVKNCEANPNWTDSCEHPAVDNQDMLVGNDCGCLGRMLRHKDTGAYLCEAYDPACGGTTLGYHYDVSKFDYLPSPGMMFEQSRYDKLVEACVASGWPASCAVPAVMDRDLFTGDCECNAPMMKHVITGHYLCFELPDSCGGVSYDTTLGPIGPLSSLDQWKIVG